MKAICPFSQIPVRFEPSERSEMVTQILFGETFTILSEKGNWLLIHIHLDSYEGWIDRKHSMAVSEDFMKQIGANPIHVLSERTGICTSENEGTEILLTKGSHLPMLENGIFQLGDKRFATKSNTEIIKNNFDASQVVTEAIDYLNAPYFWGGRSIMGVDCSGLVQIVYHICGMDLPRDASQQARKGDPIDFVHESMQGDLAFFDNPEGEIIHVGIIIEPGKILHASGHVKIDKLDHNGIFNEEQGTYTHKLRIIKRFQSSFN